MTEYAVAWNPRSDNMGDNLRTLAAVQLLPRIDRVLDADGLDAPLTGLGNGDRVVTLLAGNVWKEPAHWPPEEHIAPVCVGVHASNEDVWGIPFEQMDGAGRDYLAKCAPVGCRDERTARLMEKIGVQHELTGCLTLTLERPETEEDPRRRYICCVDVPETAARALRESAAKDGLAADIFDITHQINPGGEFQERMESARQLLRVYAGASFVVTRRLHCAMACLAIGTPVLLVYNGEYEDVTRFAPMDQMLNTMDVETFIRRIGEEGFPKGWTNPPGIEKWKEELRRTVEEGIRRAESMALPLVSQSDAEQWRIARLWRMADSAAEKIRRLEKAQYESLHEKFAMLDREDHAKSLLNGLMGDKRIIRAMERHARRERLRVLPWHKRPAAWFRLRREPADVSGRAAESLSRLGWPEGTQR